MKKIGQESSYSKKRFQAKEFYSKIGSVRCPAFKGGLVFFNSYGFTHLIRKNGVLRPKGDQMRRFKLLKQAISVITDPEIPPSYQKEEGVEFWEFKKVSERKTIKVIIRRFQNGTRHFFSIMNKR